MDTQDKDMVNEAESSIDQSDCLDFISELSICISSSSPSLDSHRKMSTLSKIGAFSVSNCRNSRTPMPDVRRDMIAASSLQIRRP